MRTGCHSSPGSHRSPCCTGSYEAPAAPAATEAPAAPAIAPLVNVAIPADPGDLGPWVGMSFGRITVLHTTV